MSTVITVWNSNAIARDSGDLWGENGLLFQTHDKKFIKGDFTQLS